MKYYVKSYKGLTVEQKTKMAKVLQPNAAVNKILRREYEVTNFVPTGDEDKDLEIMSKFLDAEDGSSLYAALTPTGDIIDYRIYDPCHLYEEILGTLNEECLSKWMLGNITSSDDELATLETHKMFNSVIRNAYNESDKENYEMFAKRLRVRQETAPGSDGIFIPDYDLDLFEREVVNILSVYDTSSKEISSILRKCIEEVCIKAKNEKETWQSKTISPHVVIYGEIFHPLIEVYALYSDRKRFPNPFAITCEREGVSLYNFKEDFVIFIKNAISPLVDIKEDVDISKYCRDVDTYRRGVKDALNFSIGKKNDKYNPFDRDIFNLNNYEYKNYFEISRKTDGILRQNNYFIKEQRMTLEDYTEVRTGRCGIRLFELYLKGDNSISAELKVDFSLHIF